MLLIQSWNYERVILDNPRDYAYDYLPELWICSVNMEEKGDCVDDDNDR